MNKNELINCLRDSFILSREKILKQLFYMGDKEFSLLWTKTAIEPIEYQSVLEKAVYNFNCYIKWHKIFINLASFQNIRIAEIGPGTSIILPMAICLSTNWDADYIAVDPNQERLIELENRIKEFPISKHFITSKVNGLPDIIPSNFFNCIVGHHIINDIIETVIASKILLMDDKSVINDNQRYYVIRQISELYRNGHLLQLIEEDIDRQIEGCRYSLKKGGIIILNHFAFRQDLEYGYPNDLYYNLIHFFRYFFDKKYWKILDLGLDSDKWLTIQKIN